MVSSSIADQCQFWLDENTGVLTSPHFNNDDQLYGHNLNCTWTLKSKESYYINLDVNYFKVKTDKCLNSKIVLKDPHSSLAGVTIFPFMMEKIYNPFKY